MEVDTQTVGTVAVVGGSLIGWIISVERRLAMHAELRRMVRRVDRRVEFLISTLAGRQVLDAADADDDDSPGKE